LDVSLRILVVGGGSIGERHLRCFQRQAGIEVALCELNAERRSRIAREYSVRRSFADVSEAADLAWDAAIICTPANLHVDQAVTLLRNSPGLFIEKHLSSA
jgi:predicted dehydrogenase